MVDRSCTVARAPGLAGGDQGAGGHRALADAARDRRGHAGVVQVDAGVVERGLLHGDGGGRLGGVGLGVVIVLLGHGPGRDQGAVAVGPQLGGGRLGLGLGEGGGGAVDTGLIGGRVDLVERLAGADQRAFLEQAGLHDAADLRAHVRDQEGRGAARQLGGQAHGLRLGDDVADLGRTPHAHAAGGPAFLTAGGEGEGDGGEAQGPNSRRGVGGALELHI
jgi:hypothetical protein